MNYLINSLFMRAFIDKPREHNNFSPSHSTDRILSRSSHSDDRKRSSSIEIWSFVRKSAVNPGTRLHFSPKRHGETARSWKQEIYCSSPKNDRGEKRTLGDTVPFPRPSPPSYNAIFARSTQSPRSSCHLSSVLADVFKRICWTPGRQCHVDRAFRVVFQASCEVSFFLSPCFLRKATLFAGGKRDAISSNDAGRRNLL